MRNLVFMLWIFGTLFLIPSIEYASGYTEYVSTRYSDSVIYTVAWIQMLIVVIIAILLYEPRVKK